MAVFTSMYDPMNKDKEKLMNENELIDQMKACDDYQSIFECLKQRALKRQEKS